MSTTVSDPAPKSIEEIAIAELEKEGHTIEGKEPPQKEPIKEPEPSKEEPKKEDPKPEHKVEEKPNRSPTMVEAWKLKVAEDQKEAAIKAKTDLEAKLDELSKQKAPITTNQANDITEEIKSLAKDKDVDVGFLTEFANTIIKKVGPKSAVSGELETTVKKLQEERELEKQLNNYSNEFEKDVLPLVKDYQLSGEALSQLKTSLRNYAFSETYAKVPLKEIFALKQETFELSVPKKSSEGKGPKVRAADVVDIDNLSEDEFAKLSPEKVDEFVQKKSAGSWKRK